MKLSPLLTLLPIDERDLLDDNITYKCDYHEEPNVALGQIGASDTRDSRTATQRRVAGLVCFVSIRKEDDNNELQHEKEWQEPGGKI